jgi:putative PIN family toxin of toxin-antitoxin system
MIRVVLDTNIVVSALLQPLGPPAQVFMRALSGSIQLCVSGSVYAEYEEVIYRPRFARSEDVIAGTLRAIREKGAWFRPTESVKACADPDDDIFLECAQAAQADYLVTGNLKHFPVAWTATRIVTPRWLLDNLSEEESERSSQTNP